MRNLKRVLSLAMASVMLLGMMVVGASAVTFPDAEKIKNTDAVDTLVALGVVKGTDKGEFNPEGIVTRAEMAKMIAVAMNSGKDPNLTGGALYPDTKGHWAAGYIDFCTNMKFVSGDNKGNFNPNATVTGTEAAKMLLITIGYNAEAEKFVNDANWSTNINVRASEKDLYNGLAVNSNEGLTRDNAAQMIYNGLQANTVKYDMVGIIGGNSVSQAVDITPAKTMLDNKFGVKKFIGTLVGNSKTLSITKDNQIRIKGMIEGGTSAISEFTYTLPNGLAWIGEEVSVLFKNSNSGKTNEVDDKDTIYGIMNTGNTTVYHTTASSIVGDNATAGKIKFNDTEYKIDRAPANETEVVTKNYGASKPVLTDDTDSDIPKLKAIFQALAADTGDTVKFVANADGEIVHAYVVESKLGKVTAVTTEKVSIGGLGTIKIADNEVYTGIAKGDIVAFTKLYESAAADATVTVVKAATVTGKITSYKGTSKIAIDGTTYDVSAALQNITDDGITTFDDRIGDEATLYLVNGMVGAVDTAAASLKNYALVTGNNSGKLGDQFTALKVGMLYSDGTKEIVTLHKDSVVDATGTAASTGNMIEGTLIKYTVTSTGTIKVLEAVGSIALADNKTLYNKDTKSFTTNAAGTTTAVASSDATLYVRTNALKDGSNNAQAGDYKAYPMRSLNTIKNESGATMNMAFAIDASGKVIAATVDLYGKPSGATTTTVYGIVSANNGTVKIGDAVYTQFEISTTDASADKVIANIEGATVPAGGLATGMMVSFEKSSDDIYSSHTSFTEQKLAKDMIIDVAVKEFSGTDKILSYFVETAVSATPGIYVGKGDAVTKSLDDKAVIVYVNAADKKGGDDIGVNAFDASTGHQNARIVLNTDGAIVAIFVETSGTVTINGTLVNSATPTT